MSLVAPSMGLRILQQPGSSYNRLDFVNCEFAGCAWLRRARIRVLRVANGHAESMITAAAGQEVEMERVGVLNEVAPPVSSNEFGSSAAKEVSILENPTGFLRNRMDSRVQKVKQALQSVEEAVAPSRFSPSQGDGLVSRFSPSQGDGVVGFFFISVFFILLFWVGNYVAPTWIFKDTVFRNSEGDMDEQEDVPSKPSEEEVDPADLIQLPTNLQPFRGIAVEGFKAGRQRARDEAEARRRKRAAKRK